jgi:hypothetical protein
MWTISQIAARDQVSKPTVSIRVKRFSEQHSLTVERDNLGRVAAVNVAEYDALRGRYDDPSKAQAPREPDPDPRGGAESYDEALRQKTWLETERRRIDLDKLRGNLVETQAVVEGYDAATNVIHEILGRLDERADDLAAVVAKEGVRGLHTALKRLGVDMLSEIADALASEAKRLRTIIAEDASQSQQ